MIDGTDDDKIHCFKPGQPCAAGRTLLQEETAKAKETPVSIDDPFASHEDDAEDENNEVIIKNDGDLAGDECYSSDED